MVVTTTAVAFILLSLGLTICGLWFLKAFQNSDNPKRDTKIGFLVPFIYLGFGLSNGMIGIGAFLFAKNSEVLYFVLIASHFILTLIAILGVYTAYYIFSPRLSPYLGMIFAGILGIIGIITTIITHPRPYISLQNSIEWNMNFSTSLLFFYILFISIGSTLYIFVRLFLTARTRQVKFLSLLLSTLAFTAILIHFIRFVLLYNIDTSVRTRIEDFGTVLMGIVSIIVLLIVPIIKNLIITGKSKILGDSKKYKI